MRSFTHAAFIDGTRQVIILEIAACLRPPPPDARSNTVVDAIGGGRGELRRWAAQVPTPCPLQFTLV